MTCIIGLVSKGRMWVGGDSMAAETSTYSIDLCKAPKVFQKGKMLIGYTSSFRMGQLLEFSVKLPEHPKSMDAREYMVTRFVDVIRTNFLAAGYAKKENNVEFGGEFIVAYQGRLFSIWGDYQVFESLSDFAVCGCGGDLAKGAMYALDKQAPKTRILKSLEIAAKGSAYVGAPFTVKSISFE